MTNNFKYIEKHLRLHTVQMLFNASRQKQFYTTTQQSHLPSFQVAHLFATLPNLQRNNLKHINLNQLWQQF
jgi:hypothetical protein